LDYNENSYNSNTTTTNPIANNTDFLSQREQSSGDSNDIVRNNNIDEVF